MSSPLDTAMALVDSIQAAIDRASAELATLKAQLREHPEVDQSATDATAKEFGAASRKVPDED